MRNYNLQVTLFTFINGHPALVNVLLVILSHGIHFAVGRLISAVLKFRHHVFDDCYTRIYFFTFERCVL